MAAPREPTIHGGRHTSRDDGLGRAGMASVGSEGWSSGASRSMETCPGIPEEEHCLSWALEIEQGFVR